MSSLFSKYVVAALFVTCAAFTSIEASEQQAKLGIVNFKQCAEKSKAGQKEQKTFETLRTQMEASVAEKDKELGQVAAKLNDADYLDGLTPDAENELKHRFRNLSQELNQFQTQYYQALQQANFKIVQALSEQVKNAASIVAAQKGLDLVINDEVTFFYSTGIDVSQEIIQIMDQNFDNAPTPTGTES